MSAFAFTTADFVVPALNANVTVNVTSSVWAVVGENVIIGQGVGAAIADPGPATFQVVTIPSSSSLTLKYLGFPGDVVTGTTIGSGTNTGGALVTPSSQGYTNPIPIAGGGTGQITANAAANALNARERLLCSIIGANFNSTADQLFVGTMPASYIVREIYADNASISLTTAAGGIYTAPAKGGTVIVAAATVYTTLTTSAKYKQLTLDATAGGPTTDVMTAAQLYLSLTTAQGAAATANIYIFGHDVS